jgi:hypothetical protein
MTLPQGPNQRWSLDFVSDTLTDGRRFRILVVVDDFTRECLCLVADCQPTFGTGPFSPLRARPQWFDCLAFSTAEACPGSA